MKVSTSNHKSCSQFVLECEKKIPGTCFIFQEKTTKENKTKKKEHRSEGSRDMTSGLWLSTGTGSKDSFI